MPDEDVLLLAERDYRFGAGPLRLRILAVDRARPVRYDGDDWYTVHGTQIAFDGSEIGACLVLVRGVRLPRVTS